MKKAQMQNGIIANVIEVDPDNVPEWARDWPWVTTQGIGWTFDGKNFTAPAPEPETAPNLTPARFEWLLAFTGLGDVWDALEGALKSTDRAQFALVKSQRAKTTFNQAATLALVAQFRPVAAKLAPDVDLSDRAIIAAWAQAAEAEI